MERVRRLARDRAVRIRRPARDCAERIRRLARDGAVRSAELARGGLRLFCRLYGARPLHLVGIAVCFLVAGLAIRRWFDVGGSDARAILTWFGAAIVGHDLVFVPLYSLVDRLLSRRPARASGPARSARLRAHIRVPAMLSGLLLLVFGPLILRRSRGDYHDASSLSPDPYLHRWLIATAVLFALSALVYAVRVLKSRRRGSASR